MSRNIPTVKRWKVTFLYESGDRAVEYVDAPNKMFALWAAREHRHGCMIRDPNVVKETIALVRP